jgi:hypothetical protein
MPRIHYPNPGIPVSLVVEREGRVDPSRNNMQVIRYPDLVNPVSLIYGSDETLCNMASACDNQSQSGHNNNSCHQDESRTRQDGDWLSLLVPPLPQSLCFVAWPLSLPLVVPTQLFIKILSSQQEWVT